MIYLVIRTDYPGSYDQCDHVKAVRKDRKTAILYAAELACKDARDQVEVASLCHERGNDWVYVAPEVWQETDCRGYGPPVNRVRIEAENRQFVMSEWKVVEMADHD